MKNISRIFKSTLNFSLLVVLTIFTFDVGMAQKSWTLQDCIEYALANNIQIKQQKLNLQLANDNLFQSKAAMLPTINGNFSHGYNYGKSIDRFTNTFATQRVQFDNFYASGQLTLFNGFQLLNTVAKNRINLKAGQYDVEKIQNDISLNLASAYLNILYNQEYLAIADDQLGLTRLQVDRVSKLVDAGTVAKSNLLNIEAQAANEELQLVNAQNSLDMAYLTLVQILDLKTRVGFDILRPQIEVPAQLPILEKPQEIYSVAQSIQPQIKSAELKVESSVKDLSIARGYSSPTLTLSGSYGTGYSEASQRYVKTGMDTIPIGFTLQNPQQLVYTLSEGYYLEKIPFEDQINDNINKSLGFYLNIPLFNGLQTRTAIKRAKIGIENARLNLETEKNILFNDVQRSYADALAAIKKYQAAKKSVEAMKEAYFYTEQKFNVGVANSVDFNESKKNLAKSESDLLNAKYEYVFKRTVLDFYLGRPLEIK
ncbi:MAG: TolC family protein [Bacteroidales bacterium]